MHGESELSWRIRRLAVSGEVAPEETPQPARRTSRPLLDRGVGAAGPRSAGVHGMRPPIPNAPRRAHPPGAPARQLHWPLPRRLTAVLAATWVLSIGGLIAIKPALEGEVLDATSVPRGGISALSRTPVPPTHGPVPGGVATATDSAPPTSDLAGTGEPTEPSTAPTPEAPSPGSPTSEPAPPSVGSSGGSRPGGPTPDGSTPSPARTATPRPGTPSPDSPAPTATSTPFPSAGSTGGGAATSAPTSPPPAQPTATPPTPPPSTPAPTATATPPAAPTPTPTPAGGKPLVAFDVTVEGLSVRFHNRTRGAVSWTWSFGDGTTSSARNPTHVYADAGRYVVSLTAVGDDGTSATATQTVVVGG